MDKTQALLKEYEKELVKLRRTYAKKIEEAIQEDNNEFLDGISAKYNIEVTTDRKPSNPKAGNFDL